MGSDALQEPAPEEAAQQDPSSALGGLEESILRGASQESLTVRRQLEGRVFQAGTGDAGPLLDALSALLDKLSEEVRVDNKPGFPDESGLLPLIRVLPGVAERQRHAIRVTALRRDLVYWIGLLGDAARVDILVRYLADPVIGEEAIDALSRISSEAAIQGLTSQLEEVPDEVKRRILGALAACNAVEAVPKLGKLAKSEQAEVRWAARDALSRLAVVLPDVAPLERDATTRMAARYAQGCLRAALLTAEYGERARAERLLLGFTDLYARRHQIRAALLALARIRSDKLARTALSYVNTPDVRETAIQALSEDQAAGVEDTLLKAYAVTDPSMQAAILHVLQRRGTSKFPELIAQAAVSPHAELRATAAWLAGGEASDADLRELLGRGAPWARQTALQHGLAQAWRRVETDETEAARALFELILEGRFPASARQNALTGIERIADPASRPLIERYLHDPDVAEEASRALVSVVAAQEDPDRAQEELRTLAEETPHAAASAAAVSALSARGEETEGLIERRGYLTAWRVIGPFRDPDGAAPVTELIPPGQKDPPEKITYNEDEFTWKEVVAPGLPAWVDLSAAFDGTERGGAYGYTCIVQPQWQPADLWLESEDACTVWLNGKQVFQRNEAQAVRAAEERVRILLNPGINRLLIKVLQESGRWGYCVRLTDRRGNPIDIGAQRMPDDGTAGIGAKSEQLKPVLGEETP